MSTLFLRLLKADDKGVALENTLEAWRDGLETRLSFVPDPEKFSDVPGSPFAYWLNDRIRALFRELSQFESDGRTVRVGLQTSDDFRFVRCWWEVDPVMLGEKWFPFAKGGKYSPFYTDIHLVVNWENNGREIRTFDKAYVRNADFYFRPGLTWPLRGITFSAQAVPRGCVFSVAGKMAFGVAEAELPIYLGVFNSLVFDYLVRTFAGKVGGVQYEVGLIQKIPLPTQQSAKVGRLANCGWRIQRSLDSTNHISRVFQLPGLLTYSKDELANCGVAYINFLQDAEKALKQVCSSIDEIADGLYGISAQDRRHTKPALRETRPKAATGLRALSGLLLQWSVGVAFGRFDIRLATGQQMPPAEPEPFDPLPASSPGMLTNDAGLPVDRPPVGYAVSFPSDGILVDDPGHDADIVRRVRQVFDMLDVERGHAWLAEACENLGSDLRTWIAKSFFNLHLRQHSVSRRKAPLYWQLGPKSRSYSVWLYYPRITQDTLYRVVTDHVEPKLRHEERRLSELEAMAGTNPTASQRRELAGQQGFVDDLRTFCADIARVAPLWRPAMDDGVVLNVAPLWRLLGANQSWQREVKKKWEAMAEGKYDWAQWAMHLWPERVVPKCVDDRSLAIAHDLIDVFWVERSENRWSRVRLSDHDIRRHIDRRQSPAVRGALESLITA